MPENLLGPAPTLLPADDASSLLAGGAPAVEVAAAHPAACLPWAVLAEQALGDGRTVEGYAYARTGYHRGLDALRRSGWRGAGPVPWSHQPNRGFLRALAALGAAAAAIGEDVERDRVAAFIADCDPSAADALQIGTWAASRQ